jgi:5'-phosphate synthase pdxT subunit
LRIGVLAVQGDFREHRLALEACGAEVTEVRLPEHLDGLQGLVIPGGESTTIGKLMARFGLDAAVREFSAQGKPIFGTCAGMILLSNNIEASNQDRLGLLDATVLRNAFGRQVDSFEAEIEVKELGPPAIKGVFIRAPYIKSVGKSVKVLGELEKKIVLVRQRNILAAAFHPELTDDLRLHRYFLSIAETG